MAFVNEPENERTIDYERNAIFKLGGTLGLPPARMPFHMYYTLNWNEQKIIILAYRESKVFEEERNGTISHRIAMCEYPDSLKQYRSQIREMLVEALTVFGVHYGVEPGWDVKVSIEIDPGIGNLNPDYDFESQKFESQTIKPTNH